MKFYSEVVKKKWTPLGGPSPRRPQTGVSGRGPKWAKNCKEWDACSMQWVRSKVNDMIEVNVWTYHEILFRSSEKKMSSSGTLSKGAPNRGLWQGVQNEQKNCKEWDACSMQWVRSKVNDLIEVNVWTHHEILFRSSEKMSSSGTLSKGAPNRGLWQGVQNEQKIVKNEMLVQCNEWEAKWMIWLK